MIELEVSARTVSVDIETSSATLNPGTGEVAVGLIVARGAPGTNLDAATIAGVWA